MLAAVSVYLSIQVQIMMKRSSSNNTLSTSVINLNIEDSNKTLVDYGFAFGVSVTDLVGRPKSLDPTLFTLEISQATTKKEIGYYDFVNTSLGYKKCDSEDLPGLSPEYLERGLDAYLYCPINKQYNVAGNYLSNNYQYISVILKRCTGVGCQSSTMIDLALTDTVISFVILNKYMDFSDYTSPVKSYIDDRTYYYLTPSSTKISRIYLEQNEAILDDDYLQIQPKKSKQFFSVEKTIVDIGLHQM